MNPILMCACGYKAKNLQELKEHHHVGMPVEVNRKFKKCTCESPFPIFHDNIKKKRFLWSLWGCFMMKEGKKLTDIVREEAKEVCAGCDVPSMHLQYYSNGKPYCPRCYEEVNSMYKSKEVKK